MIRGPPRSTPFPYTALFRSCRHGLTDRVGTGAQGLAIRGGGIGQAEARIAGACRAEAKTRGIPGGGGHLVDNDLAALGVREGAVTVSLAARVLEAVAVPGPATGGAGGGEGARPPPEAPPRPGGAP